jgi:hypothetical protein
MVGCEADGAPTVSAKAAFIFGCLLLAAACEIAQREGAFIAFLAAVFAAMVWPGRPE